MSQYHSIRRVTTFEDKRVVFRKRWLWAAVGLFSALFIGCKLDDNRLKGSIRGLPPSQLVGPSVIQLLVNQERTIEIVGGQPPYEYHLISGSGVLTSDGVYQADSEPGTAKVRITDKRGTKLDIDVEIFIPPQLKAESITLTARSKQSYDFSAPGGIAPLTYEVVSGPGQIDSHGQYTAGEEAGEAVVRVTDHQGNLAEAIARNVSLIVDGPVYAQKLDSQGNYYVGGSFRHVYPQLAPGLVALDTKTAARDFGFDLFNGFNGTVRSILSLPDGSLIVGGNFTEFRGVARQRLARLSASGALDASFDSSEGFDGEVYSLVTDGEFVYVGGDFTEYGSVSRQSVARLNLQTADLDLGFDTSSGFDGPVHALALEGSALFVGGAFTSYKTETRQRIAKIHSETAELDEDFDAASGFNNSVWALALSPNGLFVGGQFTSYQSTTRQRVAKLDPASGALDMDFDTTSGFNQTVRTLLWSDQGLYAGGQFSNYKGVDRQRLALLDSETGSLDTVFETALGFDSTVESLLLSPEGLYVGGSFLEFAGSLRERVALLDPLTASLDNVFGSGSGGIGNNSAFALAQREGHLIVGGNFFTSGGIPRLGLAKFLPGGLDLDFSFDTSLGFNGTVLALEIQDNNLYVGGDFSQYKGIARSRIAKLNRNTAELDADFDSSSGFEGRQVDAIIYHDGGLVVGGIFSSYQGAAQNALVRLNALTAERDTDFLNGLASGFEQVHDLKLIEDEFIAVGYFFNYSGQPRSFIFRAHARTGALNETFAPGLGARTYAVDISGGSLFVAGRFTGVNGFTRQRVAKVDLTDGATDLDFDSSSGFTHEIPGGGDSLSILAHNGSVFVGGNWNRYGDQPRRTVAKLNADTAILDGGFIAPLSGPGLSLMIREPDGPVWVGFFGFTTSPHICGYLCPLNQISGQIELP